jgi:dTDP-4-dehydrorhamnose 3,5-epimerase-like enzyme
MDGVKIERIRMFQDTRGKVFNPIPEEKLMSGTVRNIHIATMRPGAVRGNHRHAEQTESICFSGSIKLVVQNRKGRQKKIEFQDYECVRVTISPGIAHAFVNCGDSDTFIVCSSDRETSSDTKERVPLISEIGHA